MPDRARIIGSVSGRLRLSTSDACGWDPNRLAKSFCRKSRASMKEMLGYRDGIRCLDRPVLRFVGLGKCNDDLKLVAFERIRFGTHQVVNRGQCFVVVSFARDWFDPHLELLDDRSIGCVLLSLGADESDVPGSKCGVEPDNQ